MTKLYNVHGCDLNQSINQFISFSIDPLQGVSHTDIEMVNKHDAGYTNNIYNIKMLIH
jgi:hypothetical protein